MSDPATPASGAVARLRERFDTTFARPFPAPHPPHERLLLVTVAGTAWVVPMHECSGIEPAATLVALPRRHPAFRGLAMVRGATLPVYDLGVLLGTSSSGDAAWLLLSAGQHRVALLVDGIEGYAERPQADQAAAADVLLTVAGTPRRLIRLADLVDRIARELTAPSSRSHD